MLGQFSAVGWIQWLWSSYSVQLCFWSIFTQLLQHGLIETTALIREGYWEPELYVNEQFIVSFRLRMSPSRFQSLDVDSWFPRLKSDRLSLDIRVWAFPLSWSPPHPQPIWRIKWTITVLDTQEVLERMKKGKHTHLLNTCVLGSEARKWQFLPWNSSVLVEWGRKLEIETGIRETKIKGSGVWECRGKDVCQQNPGMPSLWWWHSGVTLVTLSSRGWRGSV